RAGGAPREPDQLRERGGPLPVRTAASAPPQPRRRAGRALRDLAPAPMSFAPNGVCEDEAPQGRKANDREEDRYEEGRGPGGDVHRRADTGQARAPRETSRARRQGSAGR